jgi:RNA polymerase sigma factor (sigma-70 family)
MSIELSTAERERRFTELFNAHHTQVLAYVRRRLAPDIADDALADTFLAAWKSLDRLSGDPLPWLYGLARGAVSHQRRGIDRFARLNQRSIARNLRIISPDLSEVIGWEDRFVAAFAQLNETEREVLRLVTWEELGPSDGAVVLGCTPTAFKVRLHRARRHLRHLLDANSDSDRADVPRRYPAVQRSPRPPEDASSHTEIRGVAMNKEMS